MMRPSTEGPSAMRRVTGALVALVLLAACTGSASGPTDPSPSDAPGDDAATPAACVAPATPPIPVGTTVDLGTGRGEAPVGLADAVADVTVLDLGGDAVALAGALVAALDPCTDAEPVAAAGPLGALVTAAALASAEARPLTPPAGPDVVADPAAGAAAAAAATLDLMDRWGTAEVLVVGEEDVAAWATLVTEATTTAAPLVLPAPLEPSATAEDVDAAADVDAEADPDPEAEGEPGPAPVDPAAAALARLPAGATLTVVASDAEGAAALADRLVAAGRPDAAVRVIAAGPDAPPAGWDGAAGGTLWLADPADPVRLLVAAAAAGARDEALLAVDPRDVTALLQRGAAIRTAAPARLLVAGGGSAPTVTAPDATVAWALDVALHTEPLAWGGWLPLDGTRIVALYGTPGAPSLGALSQQDLDATIARVRETAARYDLDGLRIVPGFDLITTVASAAPGPAGDYSQRVSIERLRPLIDRAGAEGMAVFIDLQPGRTDFLVQAQEYEELLLEPHVFLALDPEWRLRPDQVHLRQIGSVEAAEVQRVADWLAQLVRRERLPQKGFMLHQFLLEMLPDRDTVVVPPELVGIVHVDGQGAIATKERTFRIMAEGADPQWRWGWKQFLRIDTPTIMDPTDVIDRTPLPVVITYQ
jgi:hypothetical protein